jgi:hypothetical protein
MANRKITRKYYFSVEGETKQWYFRWLEKQINHEPGAGCRVSFNCKKKDPLKYAKALTVTHQTEVTHIFDYESSDLVHTTRFATTLDRMKKAEKLGKKISYKQGYSNFSFDLWIVLHKADCLKHFDHRGQYLEPINKAYGENFENLDQYKHEKNFERVLLKLSLQNVMDAVCRAQKIASINQENGYKIQSYKGFSYYRENPSLSIWKSVDSILSDCGLTKS